MTEIDQLVGFLDGFLEVKKHGEDTGLKISGSPEVRKIGGAVDLSLHAIEQATVKGCDLLFTHHSHAGEHQGDQADNNGNHAGHVKIPALQIFIKPGARL